MTDERLLGIKQTIAITSKNSCIVKNSDVYELIVMLEAERKKVSELINVLEEIKEMDEYELLESSWSVCDIALKAVK